MILIKIFFIIIMFALTSPVVWLFIAEHNDNVDDFNKNLYLGDTIVFRKGEDIYRGVICKTYREDITVKVKDKYFTINHSQVLEKLNKKKRFL